MIVPAMLDGPNIAAPPVKGAVASVVLPFLNVTMPVGVPAPGATGMTIAMSAAPFCANARLVVVLAWVTTRFSELLPAMKVF